LDARNSYSQPSSAALTWQSLISHLVTLLLLLILAFVFPAVFLLAILGLCLALVTNLDALQDVCSVTVPLFLLTPVALFTLYFLGLDLSRLALKRECDGGLGVVCRCGGLGLEGTGQIERSLRGWECVWVWGDSAECSGVQGLCDVKHKG
jgi:hypothetical protein